MDERYRSNRHARHLRPLEPDGVASAAHGDEHPMLALQKSAGNAAVAALVAATFADTPVPAGPGAAAVTVQRVNSFYSGFPKSTRTTTPLAAIAQALEADAGVSAATAVKHWRTGTNLQIPKTYRTMLTGSGKEAFQRPDEAAAWLDTPNPNPGTRQDPAWITGVGNLGRVEDQIKGETPQSYNGGHLIAWEFLNAAANVEGNIAPQAMLQNQALYRRIERTLEERSHHGLGGVEVTVTTPYSSDPYQVTYQQLFDRGVITDPAIQQQVAAKGALGKSVTLSQMAPDTYGLYVLTQSGTATPAKADKREAREGVKTYAVGGYDDASANKVMGASKPPPLSILATNVDATTMQQTAFAFAHQVYLNYRTAVLAPAPDEPVETYKEKVARAREVMRENERLAVIVMEALVLEFNLSPTQAEDSFIAALIASEPPTGPDVMDFEH